VTDLRVRDLGDTARIEVDPAAVPLTAALPGLADALERAGFTGHAFTVDAFGPGRRNTIRGWPDTAPGRLGIAPGSGSAGSAAGQQG
jgi:hypothetical protein